VHRDPGEQVTFDWEPIGTSGRARLTALGATTGETIDIDTIDLGLATHRRGYAARIAEMFTAVPQAAVEDELLRIAEERLGMRTASPAPPMTLAVAIDSWKATTDTPRIETCLRPLDDLTGGGLPLGSMTVIAGQPATGKSALALQAVIGALLADSTLHAVWGLGEMTPEALAVRSVAVGSVLLGQPPVTKWNAERRSTSALAVAEELQRDLGTRLHIAFPLTLDRLEAAVVATGAKLLVADYLQLVRVDGATDRRQEVDAVVKGLRELTLAHGLALVAVSNIAKSVGRDSRIGSIGKESAEVDFAADLLLLGEPDDIDDDNGRRAVRWRCMKNRHGRPRDIEGTFDGDLQMFTPPQAAIHEDFAGFGPREDR
jgi:replicative DNA helicase